MKSLFTVALFLVSATVASANADSDARANTVISQCNTRNKTQINILVCKYRYSQDLRELNLDVRNLILVENNKDGDRDAIIATTRQISLLRDNSTDKDSLYGMADINITEFGFTKVNSDADRSIRVLFSNLEDAREELTDLKN